MSLDLTTNYGGLTLRNPIVVGACPMMASERARMEVEAAGAAAIVLPSLYEEQVVRWNEYRKLPDPDPPGEDQSLRDETRFGHDPWTYLSFVNRCSVNSRIPVLASINGSCVENWTRFACELELAGAHGIELNIYHRPAEEIADPRELEDNLVDAVTEIRKAVLIPVFAKLSRQYTSVPHIVSRLSGIADGVVMFGREPDLNICTSEIAVKNHWGLTESGAILHSLRTILHTHRFCPEIPIAASGGIGSGGDVVRSLLAGADVAMITSAIYRESPAVIQTLLHGLEVFMRHQKIEALSELTKLRPLGFTTEEERSRYAESLSSRMLPTQNLLSAQTNPL